MLSDLIEFLFPMRDKSGATLTLIAIAALIVAVLLWIDRKLLIGKMKVMWLSLKSLLPMMPAWIDCKITDALSRPVVKASIVIMVVVVAICALYVFIFDCVLRPVGMFWAARVVCIRQLIESHSKLIFWSAFVVYCILSTLTCLKWSKKRNSCEISSSVKVAPGHDAPLLSIPVEDTNRISFVKVLAEAVAYADVRNDAEFIGVYGVWGSGKTSVANSLKNDVLSGALKECGVERVCVVNFNPMEFHSSDDALSALFKEIVAQLNSAYNAEKVQGYYYLAKAFKAYSTNLYLRRVKLELGTIGELLEIVRQWFYLHVFRVAESKLRLSEGLRAASIRLILVVDDLERMPCRDVCRIMNFLKANLDFPNIVVLILSDKEHLCRSMAEAIGYDNASDDVKLAAGNEYLEKFIQRSLEVPGFSRDMVVDYFRSKLPEVLMDVKEPEYEDAFATLADFATTMRQVNKILGRMWATVRYYLHHEGHNFLPYHIGDLAALTVIAEFEPRVYKNLRELIHMLRPDGDIEAFDTEWGVYEQFIAKWIDDNVINAEHKQHVRAFLVNQISLVTGVNKVGEAVCRIDNTAIQAGNYSFRIVAPSWTDMYFRDFSRKVPINPGDLNVFRQSVSNGSVPESMLKNLITNDKLELFLDILIGQPEFKTDGEFVKFVETLLWLSAQKYGPRYFANLSGQGFYENTIYKAIYRVWVSYWTRVVKISPIARKEYVGKLLVQGCRSFPSCHFIRQLLSSDSINHKKNDHNERAELCMFSDEQYEELVDLYLDAVEGLQADDQIFDDSCYLDLFRAWNILLIRRGNINRYDRFRTLIERSLDSVANILKLRIFYVRSAIDAGDGEEIVSGIYFTGIDLQSVERLFGLQLLRKIASRINEAYMSLTQEDKVLSAALTFVAMMDLDPKKCSAKQQIEYLRDVFSAQGKLINDGDRARTLSSLRDEFMVAVSKLDFTQQLVALGLAYQVKSVEKREGTIELGYGLFLQTSELLMRGGVGSDDDVYCPVFVYDVDRMALGYGAANEEYLSASLHVSQNFLMPLAKSICGHEGNTYEAFEYFVKQNKRFDPDRIRQCAKALRYGSLGDYSSAAQLLIPQVEHLIRGILKANGIQGSKGGSKGLGALLHAPGIEHAMSKVVLFELRALFMAKDSGLNIRNLFAHGELTDYQAEGLEAFYIWWFFIRMIVNLIGVPIDNPSDGS